MVIHEANASAGLANRVGARTADRVLSAVPDSGLPRAEVVGVPVRAAITALDRAALRAEARKHFGFADDARVLLVFGGSQGAVVAQPGGAGGRRRPGRRGRGGAARPRAQEHPRAAHARAGDPPYVAVPYLDRMDLAYAAADLAICRSGAMTVAEVSAVGLPAIYVPLPIGNGEQRLNALPVVNAGGGMLVADAELTPDLVARQVGGLLNDPQRLAAMTAAAARVGHPRRSAPGGPGGAGHRDRRAARAATGAEDATVNAAQLPPELQRVHMVGIGGAGMSGIARILLDRGGLVSGSDAKESRGVHALRARGALIRIGHDASSLDLLPGGATAVITTHAAIPKTNPELVEARRRGIPVVLRPAVLAKLMDGRTTLMVTGTHGKTTTTSMLIVALQHCGRDPSFAVGGELGEAGTNAHHGSGDCFVAEADESDGSLLEYTPNVAVVTNIETDHLDFYGSADAYVAVFDSFMERLAPGERSWCAPMTRERPRWPNAPPSWGSGCCATAVGQPGADHLAATLLSWEQQGTEAVAHVQLAGEPHPRVMRLSVPGRHMALNALGALLAAIEIGASADCVLDGLAGFEGVRRRFELVGPRRRCGCSTTTPTIPPRSARRWRRSARCSSRAAAVARIVVFQPHLYSRTKAFAAEFGHALDAADEVFVLDVYGAREQPLAGVSGASVAEHVSVPVRYVPDFSAVAEEVAAAAGPGDVIVTMGAGDVTLLGPEIVTALRVRANRSAPGRPGVLR